MTRSSTGRAASERRTVLPPLASALAGRPESAVDLWLGQQLRQLRKQQGRSLAEVARAGLRSLLFLGVPTPEQLRRAGPLDAVGIAGGADKCRYVIDELGFDDCVDHKLPDLPGRLARAVPQGIDVYFENVGGAVFDAVLPLLNPRARPA
ncbi:hypothetical protein G6F32_014723 [Rhizopus arrhizus]|nr:hypothetical protein G6F32_014723 [Rhizopus arrhizus]